MENKQSTSRIIDEMNETMCGLHRCGVLSTKELKKFIKGIDQDKTTKSQTSQ